MIQHKVIIPKVLDVGVLGPRKGANKHIIVSFIVFGVGTK